MAYMYANIIWNHAPNDSLMDYVHRYGIVNVGGNRWAVVEDDHSTPHLATKTLTIVNGRQTAIGFVKLLSEK